MGEVTGYTAERMKAIEDNTVVNGDIDENGHLILTRFDGTEIDAGPTILPPDFMAQYATGGLFPIDEYDLAAPAAAITFSNIPPDFVALHLSAVLRSDVAAAFSSVDVIVNADTSIPNYAYQRVMGNGAGITATEFLIGGGGANAAHCLIPANTGKANAFGLIEARFPHYKEAKVHAYQLTNSAIWGNLTNQMAHRNVSAWHNNDAPIDRIQLRPTGGGNFVAGSRASLYGVMSAFT